MWAPIYSPEMNAIEFYFSQLKHRVKKARLQEMVRGRTPEYETLVENAVKDIDVEVVNKCVDHVLKIFKLKEC